MEFNKETKFYMLAENKEDMPDRLLENLNGFALAYGYSITDAGLYSSDAIILYIKNEEWGTETIKFIRTQPSLFLKPLLIFSNQHIDKSDELVDDEIVLPAQDINLNFRMERLISISRRVNGLTVISEDLGENRLKEILLLRFLFTREDYHLDPVRNTGSSLGYIYTLAQLFLDTAPGKEVDLIAGLEESFLLKGEMIDKVNLCPFCEHFHINFREVCINCHSLKINEEATIHHYRCAYVGREKEFRDGYILRCPKCRKEVRHIGVDYDKPSEDLWCAECGSNFNEPLVVCFCLNCARTFSPSDAISKHIKKFSITQEGNRAAEEGILSGSGLMDILKKEIGYYRFEVFREIFKLEMARCTRYKYDSTLVRLNIENFKEEVINEKGIAHAKKLSKELAIIFNSTFRTTDILTDLSDHENLVLFTHTDIEKAKIAIEKLKERVSSLFKRRLDFKYELLELRDKTESLETILGR